MIQDRILHFIVDELDASGTREITVNYPLLDRGVLDSLGLFQLVSFLEEEYGVEVQDEELVPKNFSTVSDIARLVEEKRV